MRNPPAPKSCLKSGEHPACRRSQVDIIGHTVTLRPLWPGLKPRWPTSKPAIDGHRGQLLSLYPIVSMTRCGLISATKLIAVPPLPRNGMSGVTHTCRKLTVRKVFPGERSKWLSSSCRSKCPLSSPPKMDQVSTAINAETVEGAKSCRLTYSFWRKFGTSAWFRCLSHDIGFIFLPRQEANE